MLTYRRTWLIKPGKMEEAKEHLVAWVTRESERAELKTGVCRIYVPDLSPNVLVYEESWETQDDREAFWGWLNAQPETTDNYAKWYELAERRVSAERWIVTEIR